MMTAELPSVQKPTTAKKGQKKRQTKPPEPASQPVAAMQFETVGIEVEKLVGEVNGYRSREVHISNLTAKQRDNLKRLVVASVEREHKLENGKTVTNAQDVFKWILEQL